VVFLEAHYAYYKEADLDIFIAGILNMPKNALFYWKIVKIPERCELRPQNFFGLRILGALAQSPHFPIITA